MPTAGPSRFAIIVPREEVDNFPGVRESANGAGFPLTLSPDAASAAAHFGSPQEPVADEDYDAENDADPTEDDDFDPDHTVFLPSTPGPRRTTTHASATQDAPTSSPARLSARLPRLSRSQSLPLSSQLGYLRHPKADPVPEPRPPSENSNRSSHDEMSIELADSVQAIVQTLLHISPPHVLDPAKEQWSACTVQLPTPSVSSLLTVMKHLNYMSANLASFAPLGDSDSPSDAHFLSKPLATDNFDIGEVVQSVGDVLGGVAAHAGVDLVLYHGDVGMRHVSVNGDECCISFLLSHILRQIINSARKGDAIELGLHISSPLLTNVQPSDNPLASTPGQITSPTDLEEGTPLNCTFDIVHSSSDSAPSLNAKLASVFLRRLLARMGTSLEVVPQADADPETLSSKTEYKLTLLLTQGPPPPHPDLTPTSLSLEDDEGRSIPASSILSSPSGSPNFSLPKEPSLEQLAMFADSVLKGKKAVFYASATSAFARHLTGYLTGWGLDVDHVPIGDDTGLMDDTEEDAASTSSSVNPDGTYRAPGSSHSPVVSPSGASVADPIDMASAGNGLGAEPSLTGDLPPGQPDSPAAPAEPTFIIIDDDVDTLRFRLNQYRPEMIAAASSVPSALQNRAKRPSLAAHHRPRSSPRLRPVLPVPESVAGSSPTTNAPAGTKRSSGNNSRYLSNSTPSPHLVIVHITSLAKYKLVKDVVQTALFLVPRNLLPEVIVVPKPAGPRRFLTALHTAVSKPFVDPSFHPIATSPMSPAGLNNPVGTWLGGVPTNNSHYRTFSTGAPAMSSNGSTSTRVNSVPTPSPGEISPTHTRNGGPGTVALPDGVSPGSDWLVYAPPNRSPGHRDPRPPSSNGSYDTSKSTIGGGSSLHFPSPDSTEAELEYFASQAVKIGTGSPASGLMIHSPDGRPAGIFFAPSRDQSSWKDTQGTFYEGLKRNAREFYAPPQGQLQRIESSMTEPLEAVITEVDEYVERRGSVRRGDSHSSAPAALGEQSSRPTSPTSISERLRGQGFGVPMEVVTGRRSLWAPGTDGHNYRRSSGTFLGDLHDSSSAPVSPTTGRRSRRSAEGLTSPVQSSSSSSSPKEHMRRRSSAASMEALPGISGVQGPSRSSTPVSRPGSPSPGLHARQPHENLLPTRPPLRATYRRSHLNNVTAAEPEPSEPEMVPLPDSLPHVPTTATMLITSPPPPPLPTMPSTSSVVSSSHSLPPDTSSAGVVSSRTSSASATPTVQNTAAAVAATASPSPPSKRGSATKALPASWKAGRKGLGDSAKGGLKKAPQNGITPPISVLIVEDNPINQTILTTWMRRRKLKYATANNGAEAVEKWRTGAFHLILMDIQMPVMDGIEATKEIRRLEKLNSDITDSPRSTPGTPFHSSVIIVALTASSLQSDRVRALAAGCNDFLTKPVSLPWLDKKIIEWGSIKALQMWANPELTRTTTSGQDVRARSMELRLPGTNVRSAPSSPQADAAAKKRGMGMGLIASGGYSGSGSGGSGGGVGKERPRRSGSPTSSDGSDSSGNGDGALGLATLSSKRGVVGIGNSIISPLGVSPAPVSPPRPPAPALAPAPAPAPVPGETSAVDTLAKEETPTATSSATPRPPSQEFKKVQQPDVVVFGGHQGVPPSIESVLAGDASLWDDDPTASTPNELTPPDAPQVVDAPVGIPRTMVTPATPLPASPASASAPAPQPLSDSLPSEAPPSDALPSELAPSDPSPSESPPPESS